jgi:hypothetical protein
MQIRWVLSQFHTDDWGHAVPYAADYGGLWMAPTCPTATDGWALVQVYLNQQQVEATGTDDRIIVCPLMFDPRPVPSQVIDAYSSQGATSGMSIAALLATLSDTESRYGHAI